MRWLADECVAAGLVEALRADGHDVAYVAEVAPRAIDPDVIERSRAEDRLLLTEDRDFGDLVFRTKQKVPGLVLIRIDPRARALSSARLAAAIRSFGDRLLGRYTVVEESRFRSRPLPSADE